MKSLPYQAKAVVGRREMASLPELGLTLCCKIDTGARTSALHAEEITPFEQDGQRWISFVTCDVQESAARHYRLQLHDHRQVTSSNGQAEWRYVIRTPLTLGELTFPVELTLTDRGSMRHPLLLGRRAMRRMLVAPGAAFLQGDP